MIYDKVCPIVGDSVLELLSKKRALSDGDARPHTQQGLEQWWRELLNAYEAGNENLQPSLLRIIKDELVFIDMYDNNDLDEGLVGTLRAIMVMENL